MKCKICSTEGDFKTYHFKEMMFGLRDSFEYFECSNCGCIQINDIPADMSKYYPENYYSLSINPEENDKWPKNLPISIRNQYAVNNRFKSVGKLLFDKFPRLDLKSLSYVKGLNLETSILDVGCGSGFCLYELKKMGYKRLLGVDPYINEKIVYKNGLTILKTELSKIKETFDLIMMHHVLEHLEDHHTVFRETHERLKDNGRFMIRIPIVNRAWETYKENWVQLDAPRHFFLHTVKSMEFLASQHSFEIEKIVYDSEDFQFWGSEQYKKDIPLFDKKSHYKYQGDNESTFSNEEISNFKKQAIELNNSKQGDQAIFILTKQ